MQWAAFEDQYGIYLVSEYASKGDVFADVEKRGGQMSEAEAVRQVLHPFLLALIYLHELNIMHRDIKPENLLFTGTGVLKVAGERAGGRTGLLKVVMGERGVGEGEREEEARCRGARDQGSPLFEAYNKTDGPWVSPSHRFWPVHQL